MSPEDSNWCTFHPNLYCMISACDANHSNALLDFMKRCFPTFCVFIFVLTSHRKRKCLQFGCMQFFFFFLRNSILIYFHVAITQFIIITNGMMGENNVKLNSSLKEKRNRESAERPVFVIPFYVIHINIISY